MPAPTIAKKALLIGIQYKAGAGPANHDLGELVSTNKDVARFAKLLVGKSVHWPTTREAMY